MITFLAILLTIIVLLPAIIIGGIVFLIAYVTFGDDDESFSDYLFSTLLSILLGICAFMFTVVLMGIARGIFIEIYKYFI